MRVQCIEQLGGVCSINSFSLHANPQIILLEFYKMCLFTALTKVYEKANSVVSYDVTCPTWLHKYIIGRKGAGIQKLTGELQKVSF